MKLFTLETDLHWFPDHFLTFSGLFSSFLFKIAKICRMALDVGFSHHFVKKSLFYYHILMQSIQKRVYTSPIMNKNGWKNNGFFIRGLNHTANILIVINAIIDRVILSPALLLYFLKPFAACSQ